MAKLPDHEDDDWPCPGLSAHPSGRVGTPTVVLTWAAEDGAVEQSTRQRVLDYTCSCCVLVYEFLSGGGAYVFRRTHQTSPAKVAYAGPWHRAEAGRLWQMLLSGEAR